MAGSGISLFKKGGGGGGTGTSINDFKLIPQTIVATGIGGGWSDPLQPFAIVEVQLNKINRAYYGAAGSVPVRFVTPTHLGNEGKWFAIQKMAGVDVYLPSGGGVINSGNFDTVFTNEDGVKPIAYYHATNEGWQLVAYMSSRNDASPQRTLINLASLTKTGLTGGATLTGTIEVHQTAHFVTMDLQLSLSIGTNQLGQIIVEIPFNLLPEANTDTIDFPILSKRFSDSTTDVLHLQKFDNLLIFNLDTSFLKTTTNQSVVVWGTLSYFKKL